MCADARNSLSGNSAFACYSIWVENKCLQDTWRQGCDCVVSWAHLWLRTERPWSTETTGLIMWVHRKVSQHCCANHVSGHRLKAGQMLGKGQWGYVILIRGGFGGVCESRFLPRRHLAEGKLPLVLSLAQSVCFLFHLSLVLCVPIQYSLVP